MDKLHELLGKYENKLFKLNIALQTSTGEERQILNEQCKLLKEIISDIQGVLENG